MSLGRSELDVSTSGRGRRIRKPSDKALAAAQANMADSSSEDDSSAEGRPATRQATSRSKARKRRAESASSGADIDSDERRSAEPPAVRPAAHQRVSPSAERTSAAGSHAHADALPFKEAKSNAAERTGSSSALLGAEALMGLAALASSSLTSSPLPPPAPPVPPPAAVSRNRPAAAAKAAPPPPPPRSKPKKETWTAATPARPPKAGAAPMQTRMVLPKSTPVVQQPEQRTWKRCATHVAIAYYIFYRQRQQLLQHLAVTNPPLAQKMAPYAMDPTYDARLLKERSMEMAKRKLMPPPPFQYMLNSPLGKDTHSFPGYSGFHGAGLTPQLQAQFAQQLQSQLAMLQHQGSAAGFVSSPAPPFAGGSIAYFGPPPTSALPQTSPQPQQQSGAAWNGTAAANGAAQGAAPALPESAPPSLAPILDKNLAPPAVKEEPTPAASTKEAHTPSLPANAASVDGAAS